MPARRPRPRRSPGGAPPRRPAPRRSLGGGRHAGAGHLARRGRSGAPAPGARPPRGRRPSRRRAAARDRSRSRGGGQRGQHPVGHLAQVGDVDRRRPQPLQQPGGRAAERACPSPLGAPRELPAQTASGRAGSASRLAQLGGAEPHRQHVVPPAGGAAHPGGRGRPDRVARGGHVQLGQHVLAGGSRPPGARRGAARARTAAARAARSAAGQPVRHQHLAGRVPGGSALTRRVPPVHRSRRWRIGSGATARDGHRQPAANRPERGGRDPRPISRRARPAGS